MAVTILDVAKHAGVSMKTVSRVLNNETGVSAATRAAVQQAVAALGYVPNLSARRLASDRSFVLGLVLQSCSEYTCSIMMKILAVGETLGYSVQLVHHEPGSPISRAAINRLILQRSVDGFIFTPPCDNDLVVLRMCEAAHIPLVRLTPGNVNIMLPFPSVSGMDQDGAYRLAQYLIGLGHRRVGFLYGKQEHHASQLRFDGFLTAMKEHGLPVDPGLIREGGFDFERSAQETAALLGLACRPTAILASNDESAAGALFAAHRLGIAVPGELSVAGIDDFPIAQKVWPPLTTVRQPMDQISEAAARLLIDCIEDKTPAETQLYFPEELVIRQSTGACPE